MSASWTVKCPLQDRSAPRPHAGSPPGGAAVERRDRPDGCGTRPASGRGYRSTRLAYVEVMISPNGRSSRRPALLDAHLGRLDPVLPLLAGRAPRRASLPVPPRQPATPLPTPDAQRGLHGTYGGDGPVLEGDRRLVTLFTRTGLVVTNEVESFYPVNATSLTMTPKWTRGRPDHSARLAREGGDHPDRNPDLDHDHGSRPSLAGHPLPARPDAAPRRGGPDASAFLSESAVPIGCATAGPVVVPYRRRCPVSGSATPRLPARAPFPRLLFRSLGSRYPSTVLRRSPQGVYRGWGGYGRSSIFHGLGPGSLTPRGGASGRL